MIRNMNIFFQFDRIITASTYAVITYDYRLTFISGRDDFYFEYEIERQKCI